MYNNIFIKKQIAILLAVGITILATGCAWFGPKEDLSAEELAASGMDLYDRGKYRRALETFTKLKEGFPFSRFNSLAELKIADAHFHLESYEEAIFAYREFQSLHPQNEAIPYVIYQVGRCYFDRIQSIDRDQAVARQALEVFVQLVNQFPQSPYAKKAETHIADCNRSLAGHEMYVGKFYFKSRRYKGALQRFEQVLTVYPNTGFDEEARDYIDRCRAALKKQMGKKTIDK